MKKKHLFGLTAIYVMAGLIGAAGAYVYDRYIDRPAAGAQDMDAADGSATNDDLTGMQTSDSNAYPMDGLDGMDESDSDGFSLNGLDTDKWDADGYSRNGSAFGGTDTRGLPTNSAEGYAEMYTTGGMSSRAMDAKTQTDTPFPETPQNAYRYIVSLFDGYVAVFDADEQADGYGYVHASVMHITETPASALSLDERRRLQTGIKITDDDQLARILQDYGS